MSNAHEYHKRQIIGPLLLAAAILRIVLFRAPGGTVFLRGWWHVW
jgi:hypothetical protein